MTNSEKINSIELRRFIKLWVSSKELFGKIDLKFEVKRERHNRFRIKFFDGSHWFLTHWFYPNDYSNLDLGVEILLNAIEFNIVSYLVSKK